MSTYLEDFLEKIRPLPPQIQRNFDLIRQLDESVSIAGEEMKLMQKSYVSSVKEKIHGKPRTGDVDLAKISEDKEALAAIREKQNTALQLAEEKVTIADQAYELVDKYIRQLDSDLKAFEETLRQQGLFQDNAVGGGGGGGLDSSAFDEGSTVSGGDAAAGSGMDYGTGGLKTSSTVKKQVVGDKRKRDNKNKGPVVASAVPSVLNAALMEEAAIDPNEPVFCFCKRVSFGDMVACENEECPIEWFHFGCVGLKEQPKGKWYCSDDCKQKIEGKRVRPSS